MLTKRNKNLQENEKLSVFFMAKTSLDSFLTSKTQIAWF